jgi:hypothetical protein
MSCRADYRIRAFANPKSFSFLCWPLGLMVWLLVLAPQGTLSSQTLLGWMARHVAQPTKNLTLGDNSPDNKPSAITELTEEDCYLPPMPAIGTIALMHSCMWPTRYLVRPQLLTRV